MVAGFKQQNAVHGLPLQLCPEEVTLALEKGRKAGNGRRSQEEKIQRRLQLAAAPYLLPADRRQPAGGAA